MCPLRVYELPELSSFRKLERNQSRYTRGQSLRVAFSSRKSHLLCSSLGHCYSGSALGNRRRIEERQLVVQTPTIRPCLFATAGYVKNQLEELCADLLDGGVAGGDQACIQIDEIDPSLCQGRPRRNLDYRDHGQTIGRTAPCGEDVHVHGRGQLQRPADEIAGRSRGEDQALLRDALPRAADSGNGTRAGFRDRAERLLDDVSQTALLVAGTRVGAAVHSAALQIGVVPGHLTDQVECDLPVGSARCQ